MILDFNQESLKAIADAIAGNQLVSIPTDTIYALSTNATSSEAVAKVFAAKHRMLEKALPVFVNSIAMAQQFVKFDEISLALAKHFWPGMLTIVLPLKEKSTISSLATGGGSTVGLRIPNSLPVLDIIELCNLPLTGTSVNYSGEPALNSAQEIMEKFPDLSCVLDYPTPSEPAKPSTIVEIANGEAIIHREGAINKEVIFEAIASF